MENLIPSAIQAFEAAKEKALLRRAKAVDALISRISDIIKTMVSKGVTSEEFYITPEENDWAYAEVKKLLRAKDYQVYANAPVDDTGLFTMVISIEHLKGG